MTKRVKILVSLGILLLLITAGILQWSWYQVDGSEIACLQAIPADCTGKVTAQTWDQQRWEQEMSGQQIQQLLELLRNSSYKKETSDLYQGNWDTTYFVFLNYTLDGQPQYLSLQIYGDEAVAFLGTAARPTFFLTVKSEGWQEALDAIFPAQ